MNKQPKRPTRKARELALKQAVADIKRRYGDKAIQKGWRNEQL
jgi:hypothetical protein|nr:MAG TPA: hypothetical protein [Caudoviricetes sp.]